MANPGPVHARVTARLQQPIPRRRALLLIGRGALATGAGLGLLVAACSEGPTLGIPVLATLDVDPTTLVPGEPVEVAFTASSGTLTIATSAWVVAGDDGSLTVFDPRCPHAQCRYRWAPGARRFECACHDAWFDVEGTVLSGPPPRPLDRFPARASGSIIEVEVPSSFSQPREG